MPDDREEFVQSNESESNEPRKLPRRPFIKATSASLLGGGLAGCMGDDGNNSGNGDDGNNSGNGETNNDTGNGNGSGNGNSTAQSSSETDLSGVTFDFWETRYFRESTAAEEAVQQVVSDFEEETGGTVNANLQDTDQPLYDAFNQGNYPPGLTRFAQGMGTLMQTGKILPFSEYQDEFDYDVMDSIGAQADAVEYTFRGWDEGASLIPITANIFSPFVGRMDLFEEAGLDPEEDFPPESYDELVETANTLRDNSSAAVGFQPIGNQADNHDVYFNVWTSAMGGADGYFFNEDWSGLNVTNDVFRTNVQRNLDLFNEHGQGTDGTPTITDEDVINLQLDGQVAMGQHAPMNLSAFRDRGGDLYTENIRWGPAWEGETGTNGRALMPGGVLTRPPDGADEATWETKQDAALAFLEYLNSPTLQVETMPYLGFMPARRDIWPEITNDMIAGNFVDTIKQTAENAVYGYPAHPEWGTIAVDNFAVKQEQAFTGELTVDQVLEQTQQAGEEIIADTQWA